MLFFFNIGLDKKQQGIYYHIINTPSRLAEILRHQKRMGRLQRKLLRIQWNCLKEGKNAGKGDSYR
jgi:hypothetical protein